MTRPKDLEKLDRTKCAAIRVIVEKGYHGATISQIAKEADVSDGYLYRHYANKADLVQALFVENMNRYHELIFDSISTDEKVGDILLSSFNFLAGTVAETPEVITFIFMMDHDHHFDFPETVRKNFERIGQMLRAKGIQMGEINNKRTVEEVLAITFGLPVKMLEMRRKNIISDDVLNVQDIDSMVEICLNALK
ncbi:MAG: hypothetical protein DRI95_14405 [Bacteroidetes bacterium]|nr:MAG: hypothetical protein DRI95_14405 [Bacteroidota bacterium]RLD76923.1 MAG: hypothetical protein DRJ07_15490 [Bacteroidota bacterium]